MLGGCPLHCTKGEGKSVLQSGQTCAALRREVLACYIICLCQCPDVYNVNTRKAFSYTFRRSMLLYISIQYGFKKASISVLYRCQERKHCYDHIKSAPNYPCILYTYSIVHTYICSNIITLKNM